MRGLTPQQKKELTKWFRANYTGGYKFDMADEIDPETYNRIEQMHPTEVFYQNANQFLEDLADNYYNQHED